VPVLPAAPPSIHGAGERDPRVGIGEAERATGAGVAEGAGAWTERAPGHGELEAEPVAGGALQHEASPSTCGSVASATISGEGTGTPSTVPSPASAEQSRAAPARRPGRLRTRATTG
jgi:hypothetical protein